MVPSLVVGELVLLSKGSGAGGLVGLVGGMCVMVGAYGICVGATSLYVRERADEG